MKHNKLLITIMLFILLLALSSCNKHKDKYNEYSSTMFDYFDTVTTIKGYEKEENAFRENLTLIKEMLEEYHKLYDIYYEYEGVNNIRTINKNAGISPVLVDDKIIDLLEYAIDMYNKTDGMMNIAMGSVLKLWHEERENAEYYPNEAKLPDKALLEEAAKHTSIDDIIIDKDKKTVYLKDKSMSLDVGAIAKGYATEQVAKALTSKGVKSYILNVGGNIRLIGSKINDELWNVGIQNPDLSSENPNIQIVSLKDYAVVTSGSYQRYYIVDDKIYHHIIDPISLMPKNDYLSVTIIAKDSGLADSMSTALFNLSIEDGTKIISSISDIYVMWIKSDMTIHYSEGFTNFIKEGA